MGGNFKARPNRLIMQAVSAGYRAEGAERSGRTHVGLINGAADLAITLASDEVQRGAENWSPHVETLQSHCGDREDHAIVKLCCAAPGRLVP